MDRGLEILKQHNDKEAKKETSVLLIPHVYRPCSKTSFSSVECSRTVAMEDTGVIKHCP